MYIRKFETLKLFVRQYKKKRIGEVRLSTSNLIIANYIVV
jgi:hypothetical protein